MMQAIEMHEGFDNPAYIPDSPASKKPLPSSNNLHSNGIHPTDVHFTKHDETHVTIAEDGASVKPNIRDQVRALHSKMVRQVIYSILRNFLVYLFLFCLCVLLGNASKFRDWDTLSEVVLLMLTCFGFAGVPAQCLHVYRELRATRRTVIPQILTRWKYRTEFVAACRAWQAAAPTLSIQISLKSGSILSSDPDHWTRSSQGRQTQRNIGYRVWSDQSTDPETEVPWVASDSRRGCWVVVSKDFRSVNRHTQKSIEEDVAAFSSDCGYNSYRYFMHREFILDVAEGNSLPDVMPYLVFTGVRSKFYDFRVYKVLLLLCLDSVYNLIFHMITRHVGEHCIVKYIER